MYTVIKEIERPERTLIAKFKEIATPVLSDVMGRHHCMDYQIRPVFKGARFCGPAYTVRAYPSDNLMIHVALKFAQAGDVLVADAGGYANAGLWGEIMAVNAVRKGIAGLVIDGGCRDVDELEGLGFSVFARGINARGGFKLDGGSVNEAVSCGGVCVHPGDLVVADVCGVVVVPKQDMETVLKLAEEKLAAEQQIMQRLRNGEDFYDITKMEEYLDKIGVKFLD
jgi:4-hydroxy-4-methyl-2-oxoglutarate aldolase